MATVLDTPAQTAEPRKARPTMAERARERVCPNCGGPVERRSPKGPFPTFCGDECKTAHSNRHLTEGRAMAAFIKAWRIDRGSGEIAKAAFAQVCQIADLFNAQDQEANRPRADLYAAKMLRDSSVYLDRRQAR